MSPPLLRPRRGPRDLHVDEEPGTKLDLLPGRAAGPGEDPYLDIGRLAEDTGFLPQFDVERAVADYVAWRGQHPR